MSGSTTSNPANAIPVYVAGSQSGGVLTAVPAGSTNGTAIGTKPAGATGVKLYLPSGASVTYAIAASQPTSAPLAFTASNSTTGYTWTETMSTTQNIYVTATSGSPLFRWV